jgi:membrane peptidoglycan carboxypeptidase
MLAVHPSTGEVLAWVGSSDYANDAIGGQFNIVLSPQQPGSSFKPYVFAAALKDHTIGLCTTLQDRPTDFGGYRPTDFDNRFMGPISARRALLLSRNVPAVEVAQQEGMDRVIALAHQMGVETPLDPNLATAIGASNVTMYDQVEAYGVFANQGRRVPLTAITRIEDSYGAVAFKQAPGTQPGQTAVLTPAEAYLVTDVLKDYQRQWGLGWNHQMAGKSGTTGSTDVGHPDAWMMAYGPDVVVGAWAGSTGARGAGQPTTAYGTNVGSTISARFVNALPRQYRGWYSTTPAGLTHGRGGDLQLAGTQPTGCSGGDLSGQDRARGNGNGNGGD